MFVIYFSALETLVALFMAYEANYPERLKAAYIINGKWYFYKMKELVNKFKS